MAPAGRSRSREDDRPSPDGAVPDRRTVGEAMLTGPATHGPDVTVEAAWTALADPHRHLLLLVSGHRLVGTLDRGDLEAAGSPSEPALRHATLVDRTVGVHEPLAVVHAEMVVRGQRRRAVVDAEGRLLGLLCLKSSGSGFCSDDGVAARRWERLGSPVRACPAREG
ncbi:hypothetical protein [Solicola sp. PLA-1-18]|uniref:CBS domain-containing protein n=1 Tax=Solicola sp. PLA-1-18 TaxID=3380532 RepID=UPI003B7C936E